MRYLERLRDRKTIWTERLVKVYGKYRFERTKVAEGDSIEDAMQKADRVRQDDEESIIRIR